MENKAHPKNTLIEQILSDENIFSAIYSIDSYLKEINLLTKEDLEDYYKLKDKHNMLFIEDYIKKCKSLLEEILLKKSKDYFDIQVFFKIKKWNDKGEEQDDESEEQNDESEEQNDEDGVECRPIHTASLTTQICIVCLLNKIMFKEDEKGKRELSDLSRLIPNNFYGNIPSTDPERIFFDWRDKYKEYTEKATDKYNEALKNHTYRYEVSLDLVKFFPSINPELILNFCMSKIEHLYENKEELKLVLDKLLNFKITNLKSENALKKYYNKDDYSNNTNYNLGIPQGLPQSYFFGNLCMIIISEEFNKIFPGESFFYVDDSIIYTNTDKARNKNLPSSIKTLNSNIKNRMNEYLVNEEIDNNYEIKVHEIGKSVSFDIHNDTKLSKEFLKLVIKEVSGIGYDIRYTMETLEDITLSKKLKTLEVAVCDELENLEKFISNKKEKEEADSDKNFINLYKKSLIRYKKFFKYRKHLLTYRTENNNDILEKEFDENYFSKIEKAKTYEGKKEIIECLDADNFLAEAQLIFNSKVDDIDKEKFVKKITNLEMNILELDKENLYFTNNFKSIDTEISIYSYLNKVARTKVKNFEKSSIDESIKYLKEDIKKQHINSEYIISTMGYGKTYDKFIVQNSNEYKRRIYNAYISKVFNIELSDNLQIYRKDNRNISYYELCLFMYIRNKHAVIDELDLPDESLKNDKIEFNIYEVLNIFLEYVKNPKYIEHLILMHKYISSIWKNGSRFLYFYTLHNQDHSVELIKRVVLLCKMIDYFQIKTYDFYILFLACYLHDISMAIQPKIDSFLECNEETDILSEEFFIELSKINFSDYDKDKIKELMKNAFKTVNTYFEATARDNHAYDSSRFIKNNQDLSMLEPSVRKEVAAVSEAHAYDSKDVYSLKSTAKEEFISEKYIIILLRIADLLDGAKDRVSLNILKHNISNMPMESRFHWVTHAITDGFEVTSNYELKNVEQDGNIRFKSILNKNYLSENIILKIIVNESNLSKVKSKNCKNASAKLINDKKQIEIEVGNENTEIEVGNENTDCKGDCTFLCKWIMTKNNYLLSELNALKLYLDRNSNNLFKTKIQIKIDFSKAEAINPEYYSIVNEKIK